MGSIQKYGWLYVLSSVDRKETLVIFFPFCGFNRLLSRCGIHSEQQKTSRAEQVLILTDIPLQTSFFGDVRLIHGRSLKAPEIHNLDMTRSIADESIADRGGNQVFSMELSFMCP